MGQVEPLRQRVVSVLRGRRDGCGFGRVGGLDGTVKILIVFSTADAQDRRDLV